MGLTHPLTQSSFELSAEGKPETLLALQLLSWMLAATFEQEWHVLLMSIVFYFFLNASGDLCVSCDAGKAQRFIP